MSKIKVTDTEPGTVVFTPYHEIQIPGPISQEDFLLNTKDCWKFEAGSATSELIHSDNLMDWHTLIRDHVGTLSLKPGYTISGMHNVKKGNYALIIGNLFYINLNFMVTNHRIQESGLKVEDFYFSLGRIIGHIPFHLSRNPDGFDKMFEITQFDHIDFSVAWRMSDGSVSFFDTEWLVNNLGYPKNKVCRWPEIYIPL